MHDGWDGGFWFGHGLFGLLVWVVVIAALVALVMGLIRAGRGATGRSARDILKERYARGEIDQAEYERKLEDLQR